MPLHSLRESIHTLTTLEKQARQLRSETEQNAPRLARLDAMIDETLETMRNLVDVLSEAHRRGGLDRLIMKDRQVDDSGE